MSGAPDYSEFSGGYIFLMGEGVGRSFVAASNKDIGAKHDVSSSLLLGSYL